MPFLSIFSPVKSPATEFRFKFTEPAVRDNAAQIKERLLAWCRSKTKEYEVNPRCKMVLCVLFTETQDNFVSPSKIDTAAGAVIAKYRSIASGHVSFCCRTCSWIISRRAGTTDWRFALCFIILDQTLSTIILYGRRIAGWTSTWRLEKPSRHRDFLYLSAPENWMV